MAMADSVARRSNCIRRAVGALIVRHGEVVSTGWNGVSESHEDCREAGCPRCVNGGDTGSGYEMCICIHAEQRAVADAARRGVSTMDSTLYVNLRPCLQCLAIARSPSEKHFTFTGGLVREGSI
jgi:dCMP deaminase